MFRLLFPPKCTLCGAFLQKDQTDFCHDCHKNAPHIIRVKRKIPFIAKWTAVWYYKDNVRPSIHRFKFSNARRYARPYARQMAIRLQETDFSDRFDILTWVPISRRRHFQRGYDQCRLLADALGKTLGHPPLRTLKKIRHTPPQSTLRDSAQRRANILGAYAITDPVLVAGKRILLLDDVITTGATASECAKVLLTAGAKEVYFLSVAAAAAENSNKHR